QRVERPGRNAGPDASLSISQSRVDGQAEDRSSRLAGGGDLLSCSIRGSFELLVGPALSSRRAAAERTTAHRRGVRLHPSGPGEADRLALCPTLLRERVGWGV